MKPLENSFGKQNNKPIHLYSASTCCCSCCCCFLSPIGNWAADKIVIQIAKPEPKKAKWMTTFNIAMAIVFTAIGIVLSAMVQELGMFLGAAGYYVALLMFSKRWLPEATFARRVAFSLMQWFLSVVFMGLLAVASTVIFLEVIK